MMMLRLLATLAATLAMTSAMAGQVEPGDVGKLSDCLETRAGTGCIGTIAEPCADDAGRSTVQMVQCMQRETEAWDVILNEQWPALMADAKERDKLNEPEANGLPSSAKSLREAQRAWIAFRDAECLYAYSEWGVGSFRNIAAAGCQRDMTAKRVIEFHARLNREG